MTIRKATLVSLTLFCISCTTFTRLEAGITHKLGVVLAAGVSYHIVQQLEAIRANQEVLAANVSALSDALPQDGNVKKLTQLPAPQTTTIFNAVRASEPVQHALSWARKTLEHLENPEKPKAN